MNLQEYYIRKAIEEAGITLRTLRVKHKEAECWINRRYYRLIFPKSLIDLCNGITKKETKTIDYCFKGVITNERAWLNDYKGKENNVIIHSDRGRDENLKYSYDIDYYTLLAKSKYALCPVGECLWSYRMFEAIMCNCIPIVDRNDMFRYRFKTLCRKDNHIYSENICNYNKDILLNKYTLNENN